MSCCKMKSTYRPIQYTVADLEGGQGAISLNSWPSERKVVRVAVVVTQSFDVGND